MSRKLFDRALFWVAFGAPVSALGVAALIATVTNKRPHKAPAEPWFAFGIALTIVGVGALLWALVLYLAHAHAETHAAAKKPEPGEAGTKAAPPRTQLRDLQTKIPSLRELIRNAYGERAHRAARRELQAWALEVEQVLQEGAEDDLWKRFSDLGPSLELSDRSRVIEGMTEEQRQKDWDARDSQILRAYLDRREQVLGGAMDRLDERERQDATQSRTHGEDGDPQTEKSRAERDRDDAARRRVLSLAHEVLTELETDRYQLAEAKRREYGWTTSDMLQAAKFDRWPKDPDAVARTDVMDALRGTYIWLHRKNVEMQAREAAQWKAVGSTLDEPGLMLDADDLLALDEGMSRILNAQESLRRLCDQLAPAAGHRSTAPGRQSEPAAPVSGDDADSDAREALAAVIKPRLAVRTTFGVENGKPTGEMFLDVTNASESAADDVEIEVRYRDGKVQRDRRDHINSDQTNEPRWTLLLHGVSPSSGDVFAEVRQRIESIALMYSDARHIARYSLLVATAETGEPFDLSAARERRTR